MTDSAIVVDQLAKTYREGVFRKRQIPALSGVSFDVSEGSIFGLLGPNGAGKTTLIKILLGLVAKTAGSARLLNLPAGSRKARQHVGYLPEHHRIPRHHTGNSALTYYGGLSGMSPAEVAARRGELLRQVGLSDWGSVGVRKYSKGMLQRLGLAQSMLHDPKLLILDEPTDGVDPVGRSEMRSLLQKLKADGKTIFINSHLLQEVELVCDRVAILVEGRIQRVGSIREITERTRPDLEVTAIGPSVVVDRVVDRFEVAERKQLAGNTHQLLLPGPAQPTVNLLVDALRAEGVEIAAMVPRRDSLEQAFLTIVTQAAHAAAGRTPSASARLARPPSRSADGDERPVDAELC